LGGAELPVVRLHELRTNAVAYPPRRGVEGRSPSGA
jgi:hypothetical protein